MSAAHELKPETVMLYSWENSLEKRELIWACGGKKDVKNDLSQVILAMATELHILKWAVHIRTTKNLLRLSGSRQQKLESD